MGKRTEYTEDYRNAVLDRIEAGETAYSVAKELGLARSTITVWQRHRAAGTRPKTGAEMADVARAARSKQAQGRVDDLVFLIENGEYHADNLSRRVGLAESSLDKILHLNGRADLATRVVYGDGRPIPADERGGDSEFHTRYQLRAQDYRVAVSA